MSLRNTIDTYGTIARFFHWAIALLVIMLIIVGLYMVGLEYSPDKIKLYGWHKSFGLLVLWLAGLRIIWRAISHPPEENLEHQTWEKLCAKVAHALLYIAIIGMPLSGWIMSSAGEYPVPFFGMEMPDLVSKLSLIHI